MTTEHDDPVIPVFIPALVALLAHFEKEKGSPLTEDEVIAIRDKGVCLTMRLSFAQQLAESRGYDDINPENVWAEWQEVRQQLAHPEAQ